MHFAHRSYNYRSPLQNHPANADIPYENTFQNEDGTVPKAIDSSALNTWIFNVDTIRQVLDILMTDGIKVDYGQKIGKTIIFAKNHNHAEKILEVFHKEYPSFTACARSYP